MQVEYPDRYNCRGISILTVKGVDFEMERVQNR
jgi:hypothetical protein